MGEKIMRESIIGPELSQDQVSHYNPETNRCYVQVTVMSSNHSTPTDRFIFKEYLFDGQTKEMLAIAESEGEKKEGNIFSASLKKLASDRLAQNSTMNPTYYEADALITKFMHEDRKP